MSNFERQLIGEIPLHEAASFFVGMKRPLVGEEQVKAASARMSAVQKTIDGLLAGDMPEGKNGRFKTVDQIKESAALPKVLKPFMNSQGLTGLGAGAVGGATGLAVGAHEYKKLKTKEAASRNQQIHDFYRHRLRDQAIKLGFNLAGSGEPDPNVQGGQPTPAASNVPNQPPPTGSMAPPEGAIQDPESAKPSTEPTVPANYMGAELMARAAQNTNEVGFLRERLNAATQQNAVLTQQIQDAQSNLDQLGQQTQMAGDQISQATNEAVAASGRALEHSMRAANMQIGIQKMREAMMELASQDPESMGTLSQMQQTQDEQAAVNAGAGTPAQTPDQGTQPGAPAAAAPEEGGAEQGGDDSGKPDEAKSPQVSIKTGMNMAIPGAVAGAGLAALHGRMQNPEDSQSEVDELETQQGEGGSFAKALDLMNAKKNHAENELRASHPTGSTIRDMARGGMMGGMIGSGLSSIANTIKSRGIKLPGALGAG